MWAGSLTDSAVTRKNDDPPPPPAPNGQVGPATGDTKGEVGAGVLTSYGSLTLTLICQLCVTETVRVDSVAVSRNIHQVIPHDLHDLRGVELNFHLFLKCRAWEVASVALQAACTLMILVRLFALFSFPGVYFWQSCLSYFQMSKHLFLSSLYRQQLDDKTVHIPYTNCTQTVQYIIKWETIMIRWFLVKLWFGGNWKWEMIDLIDGLIDNM